MEKKDFYYSVEPIYKEVSEEEFLHFINNYPRKLERDVTGICDPPAISYNDFELADCWPYSVVASEHLWPDDPNHYFYCPKEERKYTIIENFEEVFASRIGNNAAAAESEEK